MDFSVMIRIQAIVLAIILVVIEAGVLAAADSPIGKAEGGSSAHGGVSETFYRYLEEYEETRIARYFVENARIKYREAHTTAQRTQLPPMVREGVPPWRFAELGTWIEEGSSVIAVRVSTNTKHIPSRTPFWRIESLTIILPARLSAQTAHYAIAPDRNDGPTIFWSLWGHSMPSCFAYASSGTLDVRVTPIPPDVAPERREFFTGNPFYRTLEAKIDIRFDHIADEARIVSGYTGNEDCQPFSIAETMEFYWRPVSAVIHDYQRQGE